MGMQFLETNASWDMITIACFACQVITNYSAENLYTFSLDKHGHLLID
jgi:hypothetical protein